MAHVCSLYILILLTIDLAFNGNVSATWNIDVGVKGTFDTGLIPISEPVGIPELSIPGYVNQLYEFLSALKNIAQYLRFITIGPELSVSAELGATIDVEAQVSVNTAFQLPNINITIPPDKGKSSGQSTLTPASQRAYCFAFLVGYMGYRVLSTSCQHFPW